MEFKILNRIDQLNEIDILSHSKLQAIFKHSIRCSISSAAYERITRELRTSKGNLPDVYYLDLISFREISNQIISRYGVKHESPQLLIIKDGKCIYNVSHFNVSIVNALPELISEKK